MSRQSGARSRSITAASRVARAVDAFIRPARAGLRGPSLDRRRAADSAPVRRRCIPYIQFRCEPMMRTAP
jgi:hypothetical protein